MTAEEKKRRKAELDAEKKERRRRFPHAILGNSSEYQARVTLESGDDTWMKVDAKVNPKRETRMPAETIDPNGLWRLEWNVRLDQNPEQLARFIHALSMRLKAQMEKIAEKSKAAREALEEAERFGRETAA